MSVTLKAGQELAGCIILAKADRGSVMTIDYEARVAGSGASVEVHLNRPGF